MYPRTYVVNRVTDKLTPLAKNIFCCRSGSAADTQKVADLVRYQLDLHGMDTEEDVTVLQAAVGVQSICYAYRDLLSVGIFVAGWDSNLGGQVRYMIKLNVLDLLHTSRGHANKATSSYWWLWKYLHLWLLR